MDFLYYIIVGVLGGVLGGMGMGGGTILIPLLTIFYGLGQHSAQAINLISFIPMAVVALIVHLKNGYVKFNNLIAIILSGIVFCILGCYLAKLMSGELLKRFFGGFLLLLSVFQFITVFRRKKQ